MDINAHRQWARSSLHMFIQKELSVRVWLELARQAYAQLLNQSHTVLYGEYYHLTFGLIAVNSKLLVNSCSLSCNMIYNANSL